MGVSIVFLKQCTYCNGSKYYEGLANLHLRRINITEEQVQASSNSMEFIPEIKVTATSITPTPEPVKHVTIDVGMPFRNLSSNSSGISEGNGIKKLQQACKRDLAPTKNPDWERYRK